MIPRTVIIPDEPRPGCYFCGPECKASTCPIVAAGYTDERDWRRKLAQKQEALDLEQAIAMSGLPEWKVKAMRGRPL
jgi:hypothetical protein